mmetsp:Transcript_23395/g.79027  ORF Transcript_23395/g.79027 Transcript_23395/m.79027 type:complete len:238 (+) Transcript_23395:450-1163(+)
MIREHPFSVAGKNKDDRNVDLQPRPREVELCKAFIVRAHSARDAVLVQLRADAAVDDDDGQSARVLRVLGFHDEGYAPSLDEQHPQLGGAGVRQRRCSVDGVGDDQFCSYIIVRRRPVRLPRRQNQARLLQVDAKFTVRPDFERVLGAAFVRPDRHDGPVARRRVEVVEERVQLGPHSVPLFAFCSTLLFVAQVVRRGLHNRAAAEDAVLYWRGEAQRFAGLRPRGDAKIVVSLDFE